MKERFLPIGTVVLLEGGEKPVMINSYCIFPNGVQYKDGEEKPAKKEMFEYGGCSFPEGVIDPTVSLAFNHDKIKEIVHMGLENEAQSNFSKILNDNYENVKKQFEDGTLSSKEILGND